MLVNVAFKEGVSRRASANTLDIVFVIYHCLQYHLVVCFEVVQRIVQEILRTDQSHVILVGKHLHLVGCQQAVCVLDDREGCPIDLVEYLYRSLQESILSDLQ